MATLTPTNAWVYAPCERTGRNGIVHVTFSALAHGTVCTVRNNVTFSAKVRSINPASINVIYDDLSCADDVYIR